MSYMETMTCHDSVVPALVMNPPGTPLVRLVFTTNGRTYATMVSRPNALMVMDGWIQAHVDILRDTQNKKKAQNWLENYVQVVLDAKTKDPVWAIRMRDVQGVFIMGEGVWEEGGQPFADELDPSVDKPANLGGDVSV